jgi:hypothetical protein
MSALLKGLLRALIGLAGALGLVIAARAWSAPGLVGAQLGLSPLGGLGEATIRADIAGFFAAGGLLALASVVRGDARLLSAPLLLVSLAILGRLVTLLVSGLSPDMLPPIAIEAGLVVLFGLGRLTLPRP